MKIPPARMDGFVQQPPAALRIALVFGPDTGAVRLRADGLARNVVPQLDDPFRISVLESDSIASDPARLYDEMLAQALGGGRRLLRVKQAEEKIAPAVSALLGDMPAGDTLLLLEAGDLDKRSKLRALAEGENSAIAALACYAEEGAERARSIQAWLKQRGYSIAGEALERVAAITPPDRLALFSELEKLTLYAGDQKELQLEDVQAALGDAAGVDLESMVQAMADGDRAMLDEILRRLQGETAAPIAMLRAAQRHFSRLLETRVRMDDGMGVKDAMLKLQPRVFWKAEVSFARQAQKWPQPRLLRALTALMETEAQCKRSGMPDVILCQQMIFTLARGAG